ncbi:type I glutamate--ammonia ligase [Criibacterium bergeronii]|uniref:glutamine synthetase n=1 Tax=Criibacterium bergeronii TaxID=1871336 RepID=A0A371IN85_9FIRM|nr:glutamine synthetase [Criibacterium bergeronii]MBS6062529.1 glutamine synthetase [Peptostreptococcaceae bacterium]RDY21886.1 glutamine synthetase [Criibacterium bergeronii]
MEIVNVLKNDGLLFTLKKGTHDINELKEIFEKHSEIKFVSLVGYDLRGNATDEKIPVKAVLDDIENFFASGVQTDGSSVELIGIASLNNAKVTIIPDMDCDWFVDYNFNLLSDDSGKPVGTLRIPAFLVHNDEVVCSRGVLKRAIDNLQNNIFDKIKNNKELKEEIGIDSEIKEINITAATELEFYVKTPQENYTIKELSTSQILKEQYWKRTEGIVRSAMETCLLLMERYGFEPEMGHKEVGGVKPMLNHDGDRTHIMEQLEIDWKYSDPMQTADNLYVVKDLVLDVFNRFGLEVTFDSKPVDKVAGSGEHTHIGVSAKLENGKRINLFNHVQKEKYYMSSLGFASLAGILNNYEIINPFVASTTDAFNRLKPGFEAPVCIVTSLGKSPSIPSRNRSILIGLLKDEKNPMQTRFELRATCPNSNLYLVLSSVYQCMVDGINFYVGNYDVEFIQNELSKKPDEDAKYLRKERAYRSEENVFEEYTQEERNKIFSIPPNTAYENMMAFEKYSEKLTILTQNGVFTDKIINSYKIASIEYWAKELVGRIVVKNRENLRNMTILHTAQEDIADLDVVNWKKIQNLKTKLMKDTVDKKSLFTQIDDAIEQKNYEMASNLQIEMVNLFSEVRDLYSNYQRNIF